MKFWRDMPEGINLKSFAFITSMSRRGHYYRWCRTRASRITSPAHGLLRRLRHGDQGPIRTEDLETVEVKRVSRGRRSLRPRAGQRRARPRATGGVRHGPDAPRVRAPAGGQSAAAAGDPRPGFNASSIFRGRGSPSWAQASAIEAGAMVHEAGGGFGSRCAENKAAFFTVASSEPLALSRRLRKPVSVIGPGMKNRIFQAVPLALHFVPERRRVRFIKEYHLGPAGAVVDQGPRGRTRADLPPHDGRGRRACRAARALALAGRRGGPEGDRGRPRHRGHRLRPEPRSPGVSRRGPPSPFAPHRARADPLDEFRVVARGRVLRGAGRSALLRAPLSLRVRRRVRCAGHSASPRGPRPACTSAAPHGADRSSAGSLGLRASDSAGSAKAPASLDKLASGCSYLQGVFVDR